jgi:hypothetical protein
MNQKKIKIKFKAGSFGNCFTITPCVQITYNEFKIVPGFAIEFLWGKWGISWRFYK